MSINGADWLAPSLTYKNCQVLTTQEGVILKWRQLFQILVNSWFKISFKPKNMSWNENIWKPWNLCLHNKTFLPTKPEIHHFLYKVIKYFVRCKRRKNCKLQNRKEFSCCNIHFHLMLIEFVFDLYIIKLQDKEAADLSITWLIW